MDEKQLDELATKLATRMMGKVNVEVDRMHRTGKDKPAAYVDLRFSMGGQTIGTVYGFKLHKKADGSRWLAVPQTQRKDNAEKWEDRFTWGSKAVQAEAERVVKARFDLESPPAQEPEFGDGGWPEDVPL